MSSNYKDIHYNIRYWYLYIGIQIIFFNKNVSKEIKNELSCDSHIYKTNKELFINVIKKYFY